MTINNPAPTITMKKPRMSPIKATPKRPTSPVAKRDTPLPTSDLPIQLLPYPNTSKKTTPVYTTLPSPRNSGKKNKAKMINF